MLSLPLETLRFAEQFARLLSVSELHQTWSSFQCSVAVTDIFLAPKSNQTRKNMLLKESDTIDAILTVVLELKHVCNSKKTRSSHRHVWILFRYQGLPRHGETGNVAKTFRGKEGFYAGSRYHLPLCRLTLFFPGINEFFPLFIQQWGHWARTGVILRKKNKDISPLTHEYISRLQFDHMIDASAKYLKRKLS